MIRRWLAAGRRPLPIGRDDRAFLLPWLFVLAAYVAGLSGVGIMATAAMMHSADRAIGDRLTLSVPADTSDARLQTVLALLRQTAGIAAVHQLTAAETAALLEPWLGPAPPLDALPVPRLVDLRMAPGGTVDLPTLRQHLASVVPEARLEDHRAWLAAQLTAGRRLDLAFVGGIAAAALLAAATALFATSAALTIQQSRIELVHLLGASGRNIARPFAVRALLAGLLGGAIGGIGVIATVAVLGDAGAVVQLSAPIGVRGVADWRIWAIVAAAALATGAIAMASAQVLAMRRLARLP